MGDIANKFSSAFRDFVTEGVAASGRHQPGKAEIRAIGALIENAIGDVALAGAVTVIYATRAALNADLAHAPGVRALVYADATAANNDIYVKTGLSGAGSWTLTTILHDAGAAAAADVLAEVQALADQVAEDAGELAAITRAFADLDAGETFASEAAARAAIFAAGLPDQTINETALPLVHQSWNLFDPARLVRGVSLLLLTPLDIVTAAGQSVVKLPVAPGIEYHFAVATSAGGPTSPISPIAAALDAAGDELAQWNATAPALTMPAGAAWLLISVQDSQIDGYAVRAGSAPPRQHTPFARWALPASIAPAATPLAGAKVNFLGDSLFDNATSALSLLAARMGWSNFPFDDASVSPGEQQWTIPGSAIEQRPGYGLEGGRDHGLTHYTARVQYLDATADATIIETAGNGWGTPRNSYTTTSASIGSWPATLEQYEADPINLTMIDQTTTYGGLFKLIVMIQRLMINKTAPIYVIGPPPRVAMYEAESKIGVTVANTEAGQGVDLFVYTSVLADVCQRLGVPFFDSLANSRVRPWDDANRALMMLDTTHISDLANVHWADQIEAWLRSGAATGSAASTVPLNDLSAGSSASAAAASAAQAQAERIIVAADKAAVASDLLTTQAARDAALGALELKAGAPANISFAGAKALDILDVNAATTVIRLSDRQNSAWRKWTGAALDAGGEDYWWFEDAGGTSWLLDELRVTPCMLGAHPPSATRATARLAATPSHSPWLAKIEEFDALYPMVRIDCSGGFWTLTEALNWNRPDDQTQAVWDAGGFVARDGVTISGALFDLGQRYCKWDGVLGLFGTGGTSYAGRTVENGLRLNDCSRLQGLRLVVENFARSGVLIDDDAEENNIAVSFEEFRAVDCGSNIAKIGTAGVVTGTASSIVRSTSPGSGSTAQYATVSLTAAPPANLQVNDLALFAEDRELITRTGDGSNRTFLAGNKPLHKTWTTVRVGGVEQDDWQIDKANRLVFPTSVAAPGSGVVVEIDTIWRVPTRVTAISGSQITVFPWPHSAPADMTVIFGMGAAIDMVGSDCAAISFETCDIFRCTVGIAARGLYSGTIKGTLMMQGGGIGIRLGNVEQSTSVGFNVQHLHLEGCTYDVVSMTNVPLRAWIGNGSATGTRAGSEFGNWYQLAPRLTDNSRSGGFVTFKGLTAVNDGGGIIVPRQGLVDGAAQSSYTLSNRPEAAWLVDRRTSGTSTINLEFDWGLARNFAGYDHAMALICGTGTHGGPTTQRTIQPEAAFAAAGWTVNGGATVTVEPNAFPILVFMHAVGSGAARNWEVRQMPLAPSQTMPVNTISSATYTLALADRGKHLRFSHGTGKTITAPDDATAFAIGDWIEIENTSATGLLTVAGAAGVTILSDSGTNTISVRYGVARLVKVAANQWLLTGATDRSKVSTQTGTAYTLTLADIGARVRLSNASPKTVTVPANATTAFPIGSRIELEQSGAGLLNVSAAGGVTIRSRGGLLNSAGQYAVLDLVKVGTDEWSLSGDRA